MLIRIVPVGNVSDKILTVLCSQLESNIRTKSRLLNEIPIPQHAYNQWRRQYNAQIIMEDVSNLPEVKFIDKEVPTLMITNEDIYYQNLNYVFALEDPGKSSCIASMARLRPEFYDESPNPALVIQRLIKEAIHSIGHLKGLDHCGNVKCVMAYSPSVGDIDKKDRSFCERCKLKMMTMGIKI